MTDSISQPVLAFIGVGNMASAIIGGLLAKGYPAERIWATARSSDKVERFAAEWGVNATADNQAAVAAADLVVLAVKPQMLKELCQSLQAAVQARQPLIVSVAAGINTASLRQWLGGQIAVVRCMPNTPSLVGTGASGLYADAAVSSAQRTQAELVLGAVGITQWLDSEAQIDAVTAVSGSGPAYYFLMMEAMIEAGIAQGLTPEASTQLTLQTALGAAQMALASDVAPAELRRRVTSPNGTTEQAIKRFEQGGLRPLVAAAMDACAERSRQMGRELGDA
ncbi:MAG TPA: pyrroline-5-carboxylate reductase [Motiliproteus sp.]